MTTASPPTIGPIPAGESRPFWSVMIPAYEPSAHHLEAVLRSVLDQDEGPDRMQIAVVDDASPSADVAGMVRRLGGERVEYHRNPSNLRLAGNWNRAIELARGRWVHLLHQDDLVLPGFYREMAGADASGAVVALCQHAIIDGGGRWLAISRLEREEPGPLGGWLDELMSRQPVQCPAVAVRRDQYERSGGFRPDLSYVLDWEMWVRLTASGASWWYVPRILACYRRHLGAETARLRRSNDDLLDVRRGLAAVRGYLPARLRRRAGHGLREVAAYSLLSRAGDSFRSGQAIRGLVDLHRACAFHPPLAAQSTLLAYYKWALKAAMAGPEPADRGGPPGEGGA